ncbi:MAG: YraN family protein [bacterium]|nr:YraN family protein [bacterium]
MSQFKSPLSGNHAGFLGERAATSYLKNKGYSIWGQNIILFSGELDIVAIYNEVLCIIEVKSQVSVTREGRVLYYRRGEYRPDIRVNNRKKHKLSVLAGQLLDTNVKLRNFPIRFDAVAVYLDLLRNKASIDHSINIEL